MPNTIAINAKTNWFWILPKKSQGKKKIPHGINHFKESALNYFFKDLKGEKMKKRMKLNRKVFANERRVNEVRKD